MASRNPVERPRELRRRVMLPARMRLDSSWCDACILNISSRGMMVHVGRGAAAGQAVEIRRGEHVIRARVMWRDGSRAGLQTDDRVPVEEILSLSQAPALRLTASGDKVERRRETRRDHANSRIRARAFEFASIAIVGGAFAVAIFDVVSEAFARPMDAIKAALGG